VVVFLATAGAVFVVTPSVRMLSIRLGAIDQPSERKVHPKPVPTMGGLGILFGVLVGLGVAYVTPSFRDLFRFSTELQGALYAGVAIAAVGVVDDLRTLSAPAKVAGQVLAAGLLILSGVELLFFYFPTQGTILLGSDLAVPLTVAWVLIVVNAVNLIDGLDGLAAGIVVIAAAAFFVYAYGAPAPLSGPASAPALLAAITAGAALGFLPHNFYPARIIMGDTGSMLLGVLLSAITISGVGRTVQPTGHDIAAFAIPVLIPVLVLALPLMDVALAILRRLRGRRPVFAPDKEHIHHQLQEIGHSHRQAVLLMYLWSAVVAGATLVITFAKSGTTAISVAAFAVLALAVTVVPRLIRGIRKGRAEAAEARAARVPPGGPAAGGAPAPD